MAGDFTKVPAGQGSRGARMNKAAEMKAKQGGGDKPAVQQHAKQRCSSASQLGTSKATPARSNVGTATDPYEFPASDEEAKDAAAPSVSAHAKVARQGTANRASKQLASNQQQRQSQSLHQAASQAGVRTFARFVRKSSGGMSAQPSSARPLSKMAALDMLAEQQQASLGKRSATQQGIASEAPPKQAKLFDESPQQQQHSGDVDGSADDAIEEKKEERKEALPRGQTTLTQLLLRRNKAKVRNHWLEQHAPPGMDNHGNTCYMNAVLQVLFSLPSFSSSLAALQIPGVEIDSVELDSSSPGPEVGVVSDTPANAANPTDAAQQCVQQCGQQHERHDDAAAAASGQQDSIQANNTVYAAPAQQAEVPSTSLQQTGPSLVTAQAVGRMLTKARLTRALYQCGRTLEAAVQHNAKVCKTGQGKHVWSISPKCVQLAMREKKWRTTQQQDAHEFFTVLLERLQLEVLTAQRREKAKLVQCMPFEQRAPLQPSADVGSNTDATSSVALSSTTGQAAPIAAAVLGSRMAGPLPGAMPTDSNTMAGNGKQAAAPSNGNAGHASHEQPAGTCSRPDADMQAAAGGNDATKATTAQIAASSPATADCADGGRSQAVAGGSSSSAATHDSPPDSKPRLTVVLREALCPGVRTFNGCLLRTFICGECTHETQTREQFNHLSLQIGDTMAANDSPPSILDLLDAFFQDEQIEKACEKCGAPNARHTQRTEFLRLPVNLALHLKRFAYVQQEDGSAECIKLHTLVSLPDTPTTTFDLGNHCNPDSIATAFLVDHLEQVAHAPEGQASTIASTSASANPAATASKGTTGAAEKAVSEGGAQGQVGMDALQGGHMDVDASAGEGSPSANKENCKPGSSTALATVAVADAPLIAAAAGQHQPPGRLITSTGSSGLGHQEQQGGPSGSSAELFSPGAATGWQYSCGNTAGGCSRGGNMGLGGFLRDLSASPLVSWGAGKGCTTAGLASTAADTNANPHKATNNVPQPPSGQSQGAQWAASNPVSNIKKPRLEASRPSPLLPTIPNSSFFGEGGSLGYQSPWPSLVHGPNGSIQPADTYGLDLVAACASEHQRALDLNLDGGFAMPDDNDEELQRALELSRQEAHAAGIPIDSPAPKVNQPRCLEPQQQQVQIKDEEMHQQDALQPMQGEHSGAAVTPATGTGATSGGLPESSPGRVRVRKSRYTPRCAVPTTGATTISPPVIVLDGSDDEELKRAIELSLQDVGAVENTTTADGTGAVHTGCEHSAPASHTAPIPASSAPAHSAARSTGHMDKKAHHTVQGDEANSLPSTPACMASKATAGGVLARKRGRQEPHTDRPTAFATTLERILGKFNQQAAQQQVPMKVEPEEVSIAGNVCTAKGDSCSSQQQVPASGTEQPVNIQQLFDGQQQSQDGDAPGTPVIEAVPCTDPAPEPMVVDLLHDSDEDADLTRALALSREQHQQETRSRAEADEYEQLQEALRQSLAGCPEPEATSPVTPAHQQMDHQADVAAQGSAGVGSGDAAAMDGTCDDAQAAADAVGANEKCDGQVSPNGSDDVDHVTLLEDDEQPQSCDTTAVTLPAGQAETGEQRRVAVGVSQNSTQVPEPALQQRALQQLPQPLTPHVHASNVAAALGSAAVHGPSGVTHSKQEPVDCPSTKTHEPSVEPSEPAVAAPPPRPLLSQVAHYRLHAAVCHRGKGPSVGHYVAHVAKYMTEQPTNTTTPATTAAGKDTVMAPPAAASLEQDAAKQQQGGGPAGYWQWWRYDDNEVLPEEPKDALQEMAEKGYLLVLVAHPRP